MSTTIDRLTLEEKILACWQIIDDLRLYNRNDFSDEDERMNYLIGLEAIYEVKFQDMWKVFEACIKNKQI